MAKKEFELTDVQNRILRGTSYAGGFGRGRCLQLDFSSDDYVGLDVLMVRDLVDKLQQWLNNRLQKENEHLKTQNKELMLMSVSERCHKTHLQCCHICEDLNCGDNTSAFKRTWRPK